MNDPLVGKITSLQRCVERARQEYAQASPAFASDYSHQDAALLNVVRTCELAINLANMAIRLRKLGVPQESRDSFRLLAQAGALDPVFARRLANMVGFRNVAVHQYRDLDPAIVERVIAVHLDDLLAFAQQAKALVEGA